MEKKGIYILIYNNAVQYASKDVKSLHGAIELQCTAQNVNQPLSYVQVTRLLNENSVYIHTPAMGHQWQIMERELLYTRRRKRAAVQIEVNPLGIGNVNNEQSLINKQSQ